MGNKVEVIVMMETLKAMGVPLVSMKVCESSEFHLLQVSPRSQKDAGPEWIQLVIQSQLRQLWSLKNLHWSQKTPHLPSAPGPHSSQFK